MLENAKFNPVFQWLLDKSLATASIVLFIFGVIMWVIAMLILWVILKIFH